MNVFEVPVSINLELPWVHVSEESLQSKSPPTVIMQLPMSIEHEPANDASPEIA